MFKEAYQKNMDTQGPSDHVKTRVLETHRASCEYPGPSDRQGLLWLLWVCLTMQDPPDGRGRSGYQG